MISPQQRRRSSAEELDGLIHEASARTAYKTLCNIRDAREVWPKLEASEKIRLLDCAERLLDEVQESVNFMQRSQL